ncbi:hypothetical protein DITRI_Ditri03aG0050700 [Diplodiscus trichospermus]
MELQIVFPNQGPREWKSSVPLLLLVAAEVINSDLLHPASLIDAVCSQHPFTIICSHCAASSLSSHLLQLLFTVLGWKRHFSREIHIQGFT